MSETLAQVQAELTAAHKQVQALDQRYDYQIITEAQDAAEMKRLETQIVELSQKAHELQIIETRRERTDTALALLSTPAERHLHPELPPTPDDERTRRSLGELFTLDPAYQDMLQKGAFNSPNDRVDLRVKVDKGLSLYQRVMTSKHQKSLVYAGDAAGGGAFPTPMYLPGVLEALQKPLTVLDLIRTTPTQSEVISYVREDARTNNAAMVAEATATTGTSGLKPESALAFSRQTEDVHTAATWIPVTNKMLADVPAIRGVIDQRLLVMLEQTLEAEILTGDGTGEHFTGILASGLQTRGRGSDSNEDAIYKGLTQVAVTGLVEPDVVVLNPVNWQTIRLSKATGSGEYLMGAPSLLGADTLWGKRVVLSQNLTANTGLVGSFALGGMYFEREGAVVRTGYIDDQFVRNMQTILVEARGAWITFRPTAFCRITGLN